MENQKKNVSFEMFYGNVVTMPEDEACMLSNSLFSSADWYVEHDYPNTANNIRAIAIRISNALRKSGYLE